MPGSRSFDAVVVGAGPNGLAAGIALARAGRSVLVLEAHDRVGGGVRSSELTLPGFVHDVCSTVHPMAAASPFFQALPLAEHGLEWARPEVALAHPFDDGACATLQGTVEETARRLGSDAEGYRRLMGPLEADWERLAPSILAPPHVPAHPFRLARFGVRALRSARGTVDRAFDGRRARGLFAGLAAHSTLRLEQPASAAVGLVLAAAGHVHGWPVVRGGSQHLADALASYFRSLGGRIEVEAPVGSMNDLPEAASYLFDVTPAQLVRIAKDALPGRYRRRLLRYRYGPGVFKLDWALSEPIPWKSPSCRLAGTVHIGGDFDAIADGERQVWEGRHPARPFVLLAQQSVVDPTRAPGGKHTAWAYCHVPPGSVEDMTDRIEGQVERYAPGFRDSILGRHVFTTRELEAYNANYVGGDIAGGTQSLPQIIARPTLAWTPYATPNPKIFLCSSSTPPGGGVHGMCGFHAAEAVLSREAG